MKAYIDALAAGQKVFDNANATQKEVEGGVKVTENLIKGLKIDKSRLQQVIDKGNEALQNGNFI